MNELATQRQAFSLAPQNMQEAMRFAEMMAASDLVPKDFINKPGNVLVAVQWGMELGLQPMQAMQNIAVINGRPSLWGDAVIGLVKASPLCEYVVEEVTDDIATCRVKRKGEPEQIRTFTKADAKAAGLLDKQGPWKQYPKRMMQMRARSWALRDVFPDVLRGMPVAEEVMDMDPRDITAEGETLGSAPKKPEAKPPYPDDKFKANLPEWGRYVAAGKKTPDDIIATVETKNALTEDQKAEIRKLAPKPAEGAKGAGAGDAPVTFAQVEERMLKATTMEALDEAADLMGGLADPAMRAELTALYTKRKGELEGQA